MKRTEVPEVSKDFELNKFITGRLLSTCEKGDALEVGICNTLIERTVEQLRKPFEDEYAAAKAEGGDNGGNAVQADTSWPKLAGSA